MKLVAIAGCSGSGKTHLARELERSLSSCSILSLDSYYLPLTHLPLAEREQTNFDHPDALDWTLFEQHLRSLLRGEAVHAPVYLFDQHTRAAETEIVAPRNYCIVEGILALHHPEARELADLKIFVDTPPEECLRRRIARDVGERGRTLQSVLDQYRKTTLPMAEAYVLPSRAHADVVVRGGQGMDEIIARLRS